MPVTAACFRLDYQLIFGQDRFLRGRIAMPFDWSIKIRGTFGKPVQFVPQGGNPGDPLNANPTTPLYLALGLSPLSLSKIRTVIALLHPRDQRQDLLNRIRVQTY